MARWLPSSSKRVGVVTSCAGGFDPHALSSEKRYICATSIWLWNGVFRPLPIRESIPPRGIDSRILAISGAYVQLKRHPDSRDAPTNRRVKSRKAGAPHSPPQQHTSRWLPGVTHRCFTVLRCVLDSSVTWRTLDIRCVARFLLSAQRVKPTRHLMCGWLCEWASSYKGER